MNTKILENHNITGQDRIALIPPMCQALTLIFRNKPSTLSKMESVGVAYILDIIGDIATLYQKECNDEKNLSPDTIKEMDKKIDALFNSPSNKKSKRF